MEIITRNIWRWHEPERIWTHLASYDSDFLALTEVDRWVKRTKEKDVAQILANLLAQYDSRYIREFIELDSKIRNISSISTGGEGGWETWNMIFSKPNIIEYKEHALSSSKRIRNRQGLRKLLPPNLQEPRIWWRKAQLTTIDTGSRLIRIANTHLENRTLCEAYRHKQIEEIIKVFQEPDIILGDMNNIWWFPRNYFLWKIWVKNRINKGTFQLEKFMLEKWYKDPFKDYKVTFENWWFSMKLDRIFMKKDLYKKITWEEVIKTSLSDHDLLKVSLDV